MKTNNKQGNKQYKKIFHSIFFKLGILIIATILIVNLLVFFIISMIIHFHGPETVYTKHLELANNIVCKAGIPPDKKKLEKAAKKYGIKILYIGPDFKWTNFNTFLNFEDIKKIKENLHGDYYFYKRHFIVKKQIDDHLFYIGFNIFKKSGPVKIFLVTLFLMLSIMLLILNLIIRKILSPINHLMTGVNKLKSGNFSFSIPVTQKDEFGQLAVSFNNMVLMLKELIKSKDQLLLDVSHELRSPLTRIKLSIEFIKNETVKKNIKDDIYEMEELITEILESEKLKANHTNQKFSRINIIDVIEEIIINYKNNPPGIIFEKTTNEIYIIADELRIKMLLKNLLSNSYRYSKQDSSPVNIMITENTNTIEIKIIDNGIGIAEKDIPYIFEPFYRTDFSRSKEKGGYGLGLFLCKKIVEMHKGQISIQSELNKGTTFKIELNRGIIVE